MRMRSLLKLALAFPRSLGIACIVVSLFSITLITAHADNGPHGGYTATTDACAGCHRAHTAAAPNLLVDATLSLCTSCHGSAGTGADTNVVDGLYLNRDAVNEAPAQGIDNRGLKAGGFTNATMDTNYDGVSAPAPVTSSHINDGSTGTAWGNGAIGSGAGMSNFSLSCSSCHDPHGGGAYRILRAIPIDSGAGSGVNVTDEAAKIYTLTDTFTKSGNQYFGEGYNGQTAWSLIDQQETELSLWCTQCHTRYLAPRGSENTYSGDAIFAYRHMSQGFPFDCDMCHDWNLPYPSLKNPTIVINFYHRVECVTCHVAHGTSASMGAFSGTVAWPDGSAAPNGDSRSSLLRLDNRGTCEVCHGK